MDKHENQIPNSFEIIGNYIVALEEKDYYTCKACNGTGSFSIGRDSHNSAGSVTCHHCYKGIVKNKIIKLTWKEAKDRFGW